MPSERHRRTVAVRGQQQLLHRERRLERRRGWGTGGSGANRAESAHTLNVLRGGDAPAGAISGNQWQSVAISGNQWRSVAISGHQWQSVAISGHQRSSVAISGHRWPSPAKRADEERAAQDKSQQGEPKRAVAQPSEQPFYKLGSARHGARAAARAGLVVSHWSLLVRRRSYEAEGAVRGNQRPSEALGQSEAVRGNHL